MENKEPTYLEKQTEATITYEENKMEITFHRAKVKLRDELEIHLVKAVNPEVEKEFTLTEDLLKISIIPPESYTFLNDIKDMNILSKLHLAYQLVNKIRHHSFNRLNVIVCPENIMVDQGLTPHLLHYGVRESIPPYEYEESRIWNESKAIVATILDGKYNFTSFLSHHETINLSSFAKQIMNAETFDELLGLIDKNIKKEKEFEETVVQTPKKKWKIQRYSIIALLVLLIPAIAYTVFASFFKIPETQAYVDSNEHYLQNQYSSVVSTLEGYEHEEMPYVVQYQLASSYIVNESLTEEQKENVQNTITLQSDEKYFLYWINIGRGHYQEAVDVARLLEDRELIIYGLLKRQEEVKADQDLSGSEREEELSSIEQEIEGYQDEMEQEKEEQAQEESAQEETQNTGQQTQDSQNQSANEQDKSQSQDTKDQQSDDNQTDNNDTN